MMTFRNIVQSVRNLSGGNQQKVVLAKWLFRDANILIFDEPTNNLGIKQERKALALIKKLRDDFKISIIIISHNIEHIIQLVDRIIVLRNGEKVGERIKDETDGHEIVSMITGVIK